MDNFSYHGLIELSVKISRGHGSLQYSQNARFFQLKVTPKQVINNL